MSKDMQETTAVAYYETWIAWVVFYGKLKNMLEVNEVLFNGVQGLNILL